MLDAEGFLDFFFLFIFFKLLQWLRRETIVIQQLASLGLFTTYTFRCQQGVRGGCGEKILAWNGGLPLSRRSSLDRKSHTSLSPWDSFRSPLASGKLCY